MCLILLTLILLRFTKISNSTDIDTFSLLHFSITYTNVPLFSPNYLTEEIVSSSGGTLIGHGVSGVTSQRLCGLACGFRGGLCRSFNFHPKTRTCQFIVTDSRLLLREDELGARAFSPGLDWIHGEPLHNVRGCPEGSGSDISGSKCVWIGLQSGTKEGVYNISSEWHLPTEGHLLYPVELHLNIWSEETHCGTYSLPAETYSFLLPNDVRAYDMEGLTPGIIYNFQIATTFNGYVSQFNTSYFAATYPATPVEREDERVIQSHSLHIFWDIIGCVLSLDYWYVPAGPSCTPSSPCSAPLGGIPSQTDELLVGGLIAGEDYFITLRSQAHLGHSSYPSPLVINQPTLPDVVSVNNVVAYDQFYITFYIQFASGVGSVVKFYHNSELALTDGFEERPFALSNTVTFEGLVPGDKYNISLEAFSKGVNPTVRGFWMDAYTMAPTPNKEEGSQYAHWPDFSVNFQCSFYYGYTKEFHIYEEDEASSPWVLTVDSIDQWFKVDQLTPGAVFNAKVHPFSPYDIQGHFIWVNESMHTANFTHNPLLITNDTITLQTIFPSGTGVQFNISAEGVFYGAPEHIDSLRVFNFSQLTRTVTWTNLLPGDMYNFSVVATSQTDEYTDIKTQITSVNESTIPADPVIVHNLASVNNGSCDISVLNDGNLFNQTWSFVYGANPNADGDNEDTWIFDLVQIGVWHELKFELEVNSVLQGAPFYHTIEGSDMHVYFDTSLAVYSPIISGTKEEHELKITAISYGKESNTMELSRYVTPDSNAPLIQTIANDAEERDINFNWNSATKYDQNFLSLWSPSEVSRTLIASDASQGQDYPATLKLGYFYWYTNVPRVNDVYAGFPEGGYLFYKAVEVARSCDPDLPETFVHGYDEILWSITVGPSASIYSNTIYMQWALPALYDKCQISLVNLDSDPNTVFQTYDVMKGAGTTVESVYSTPSFTPGVKVKVTVKGVNSLDSSETAADAEFFTQTFTSAPTLTLSYPSNSVGRVLWADTGTADNILVAIWCTGEAGDRTSVVRSASPNDYVDFTLEYGKMYTIIVLTEREGLLGLMAEEGLTSQPAITDTGCEGGGFVSMLGAQEEIYSYKMGNVANSETTYPDTLVVTWSQPGIYTSAYLRVTYTSDYTGGGSSTVADGPLSSGSGQLSTTLNWHKFNIEITSILPGQPSAVASYQVNIQSLECVHSVTFQNPDLVVVSFDCPAYVPGCPWIKVEKVLIAIWNSSDPFNAAQYESDNLQGSVSIKSEFAYLKEFLITGVLSNGSVMIEDVGYIFERVIPFDGTLDSVEIGEFATTHYTITVDSSSPYQKLILSWLQPQIMDRAIIEIRDSGGNWAAGTEAVTSGSADKYETTLSVPVNFRTNTHNSRVRAVISGSVSISNFYTFVVNKFLESYPFFTFANVGYGQTYELDINFETIYYTEMWLHYFNLDGEHLTHDQFRHIVGAGNFAGTSSLSYLETVSTWHSEDESLMTFVAVLVYNNVEIHVAYNYPWDGRK